MPEFATLTEDEFRRLCEFLYRRTGMIFTEAKRYYVERRAVERMTATGSDSFEDYFGRLRSDARGGDRALRQCVYGQRDILLQRGASARVSDSDLLAARLQVKQPGEPIRIWSVPCSTGEEPYSIAMWLLENWPLVDQHDIEIFGSDIDTKAVAAARAGIYTKRAFMRLPPYLLEKYFEPEHRRGLEDHRRLTTIRAFHHRQYRRSCADEVAWAVRRDLLPQCPHLFRRYFPAGSRRENLYENLLPGGFICLGHTESMSRISSLFEVARFADAIVYQRPLE